ncbi:MAG: tetratricopeptide repeat protein [Dehalococcoidia bacterium]|nr:tetratricopeptide repeat protein [Dehalococcoidia bacterium]
MKATTTNLLARALALAALALPACHSPDEQGDRHASPYRPASKADRNPAKALDLNRRAAEILAENPDSAERLLREALSQDLYCGPAHNNLGVVFLARGDLYEAASEFEWARKLMPGHPDPRVNLGMVLERAQRVDEAIASYRAALEVTTEDIGAMQALARAQVFHGREDEGTEGLLREVSVRGETEEWRSWAAGALAGGNGE